MTKKQCERIFDRFAQADNAITPKYGGTPGDTISKELVELMGGTIGVKAGKERKTFWFSVPLEKHSRTRR